MGYDQAQSPRLGQTVAPESPGIRIVSVATMPEIAYKGQLIFVTNSGFLYIYNGSAWDACGNSDNAVIYVQDDDPDILYAINTGDAWVSHTTHNIYSWNGAAWTFIGTES